MLRTCILFLFLAPLGCAAVLPAQVVIDHRYSNTDAQSLIGLPMGSHKTIVDKQGNLKWSQWSLKRKPLDTPIGFSDQMDGELAIQAFAGRGQPNSDPLKISSQQLYQGRYPFIVSSAPSGNLTLEELAFAVDPDAVPGEIPTAHSGAKAFDVVRLTISNSGASAADFTSSSAAASAIFPATSSAKCSRMAPVKTSPWSPKPPARQSPPKTTA